MLRWRVKSVQCLHSLRGEMRKLFAVFAVACSDSGSDGGAGLSADGQSFAAESGGEGQLRVGRRGKR